MSDHHLEQQLAYAREMITVAERDIESAEKLRAQARDLGGGLLSFGGSGKQGARRAVEAATDRGLRAAHAAGERLADWKRRADVLEARIAERDRVRFTGDDLADAAWVRSLTHGWRPVVRVNKTTVTVRSAYSWNDRIPLDQVLEHRAIAKAVAKGA